MRMPASRRGARAPSASLVKTHGDRESPKGRTLYCHARPSKRKPQKLAVAWKNGDMEIRVLQVYGCKPIPRTNALENAPLREHSERQLVQTAVQNAQI